MLSARACSPWKRIVLGQHCWLQQPERLVQQRGMDGSGIPPERFSATELPLQWRQLSGSQGGLWSPQEVLQAQELGAQAGLGDRLVQDLRAQWTPHAGAGRSLPQGRLFSSPRPVPPSSRSPDAPVSVGVMQPPLQQAAPVPPNPSSLPAADTELNVVVTHVVDEAYEAVADVASIGPGVIKGAQRPDVLPGLPHHAALPPEMLHNAHAPLPCASQRQAALLKWVFGKACPDAWELDSGLA